MWKSSCFLSRCIGEYCHGVVAANVGKYSVHHFGLCSLHTDTPEVALAGSRPSSGVRPGPGLHRQEVGDVGVDQAVTSLHHIWRNNSSSFSTTSVSTASSSSSSSLFFSPSSLLPSARPDARLVLAPLLVPTGRERGEVCVLPTLLGGSLGQTHGELPCLQIHGGLARFRGDADADVGAALGGHVGGRGAGLPGSLLRGQDVSLPPEVGLVDLHGLARRLRPIFHVRKSPEEQRSLRKNTDSQEDCS